MDARNAAHGFGARFNADTDAVVIEHLELQDAEVVTEAKHWTTGVRGACCEEYEELAAADLSRFAREALSLGAKALALTAQSTEARAMERMLKEVGEKTSQATRQASDATAAATKTATEAVTKAAEDASKAITLADESTRKLLSEAVVTTKQDLVAETRRLFGGENPELLEKLRPLLDKFAITLEKQVQDSTSELINKATRQLDPSDPTSPMAKHAAALTEQQTRFTQQIEKGQAEISAKVDDLATVLRVQEAKASMAKVTPIKGASFEAVLHGLLGDIAAGLGDEYEDTTTKTGLVSRSKKGDGLLTASQGAGRVVIEMTDSSRNHWGTYLDEAERNRGAHASLGIVRTQDQNGGHAIRVLGQRRVVIAFDPEVDDTDLLRTVVQLLRTVAISAAVRTGEAEIDTAEEKIKDAIEHLEKIDAIKKLAGQIQKSGSKIELECTSISTAIRRLLDQALVSLAAQTPALAGGEPGAIHEVA